MRYDGFIGVKFVFVVACRWIECGEGRHAGARTSIRQSRLELSSDPRQEWSARCSGAFSLRKHCRSAFRSLLMKNGIDSEYKKCS
jgi:hypothetical protein